VSGSTKVEVVVATQAGGWRDIANADLSAIDSLLGQIGGIAQAQALLTGMKSAGKVVSKRAAEVAPMRLDKYKRSAGGKIISISSIRKQGAYRVVAFVRDNEPVLEVRVKPSKRAPHAHLVELGHDIVTGGTKDTGRTSSDAGLEFDPKLGRMRLKAHRGRARSRLTAVSKRTKERGGGAVKGRVEGRPFILPAGAMTRQQQTAELVRSARQAIKDILSRNDKCGKT